METRKEKTISRMTAIERFQEILEILCEGIDEPAGRGCGYGFDPKYEEDAFEVFQSIINEIAEEAVKEVYTGHTSDYISKGKNNVADRILSRIKTLTEQE